MSFPPGTEMFQFPGFASLTLFYSGQDTWFAPLTTSPTGSHPRTTTSAKHQVGCPIRRSLDQSLFPAPQSLSQGITSFIASCCQGIHQTPLSRLIRSRRRRALLCGRGSKRPTHPHALDPEVMTRTRPLGRVRPGCGSRTAPSGSQTRPHGQCLQTWKDCFWCPGAPGAPRGRIPAWRQTQGT